MSAFLEDTLWSKSKVFLERALKARDDDDASTFHLWAALSIELLAKAALAHVHPSLVADPSDIKSLLHACGVKDPPDKKSITAKTVYERLTFLSVDFDEKLKKECMFMANRRNTELHSGESPVAELDLRAWVPSFWRAVKVILAIQSKSLEAWVGNEEAGRVEIFLDDLSQFTSQAVAARIARRAAEFTRKYPIGSNERHDVIARSQARPVPRSIIMSSDESDEATCPSCGSKAWLLGFESDEEVIDFNYGDSSDPFGNVEAWETVRKYYSVDAFRCIECGLVLEGRDELSSTDLASEFTREEEREPDYEPDYGNC